MNDTTKKLMGRAYINNTFDIDAVDYSIKKTLENSYHYLKRMQRNLIEYKHYYFPSSKEAGYETRSYIHYGELYLDDYKRVCIMLKTDIVDQDKRAEFYKSKMYRKEFTLQDVSDNNVIFDKTILFQIDGEYLFDIKLKVYNGDLIIILPFKTSFLYDETNGIKNHQTSIIVMANDKIRTVNTNKGVLTTISGDINNVKITPSFLNITDFRNDGTYCVFVNKPNTNRYTMFSSTKLNSDGTLTIRFSPAIRDYINSLSVNFDMNIVFMKDMYEFEMPLGRDIQKINNNNITFVIEKEPNVNYNSPIPVENIHILKEKNGDYQNGYNLNCEIKYPNIYNLLDPNMTNSSKYKIFYFYRPTPGIRYFNKFKYWYNFILKKFSCDTLQEFFIKYYESETTTLSVFPTQTKRDKFKGLFTKILNYNDPDIEYNVIDYVKNPANNSKDPFEYKVNTLHKMVINDFEVLRTYVNKQTVASDTYRMFVKYIDLDKRKRTSTINETGENNIFNEERYMFIFTNMDSSKPLNIKIWVDGLLMMDVFHAFYFGIDYIYIPTKYINQDSYIEIEINHSLYYRADLFFTDIEEWVEMKVINNDIIYPTLDDIDVYVKDDPSDRLTISQVDIHIVKDNGLFNPDITDLTSMFDKQYNYTSSRPNTTNIVDGNELYNGDSRMIGYISDLYDEAIVNTETKPINYTYIDKIRFRVTDPSYLNKELVFEIRKNSFYEQKNLQRTSFPIFKVDKSLFRNDRYEDFMRIWYNGRLVCERMYKLTDLGDELKLQMLFPVRESEFIALEIVPYTNKKIYSSNEYDINEVLETGSVLNKPMDLDYYDVFLNGRKVTEKQLFMFEDKSMKFYNCKSFKNILIYEKERDVEFFGYDYPENKYIPYVSFDEILAEDILTTDEIKDIVRDIIKIRIVHRGKWELVEALNDNVNTENDACIDSTDDEDILKIKIFYYEELLPKIVTDPNTIQFVKTILREDYIDIYDTYMIFDSPIADAANTELALSPTERFPKDILMLDPNKNASTATDVYFVGKYDGIL